MRFGKIFTHGSGRKPMALPVGKAVPQFELASTDKRTYSLQAALGQGPLLVVFFKVTCPTCQYSFPFIQRIYNQLGDKGAKVWAISQDNVQDSLRFAKEYQVSFPILIDEYPYPVSRAYSVKYVPTLYLISPDSRIQLCSEGFSKVDFLSIHKTLAESSGVVLAPLFESHERIPEYKPG
jgi:peroxiredoxin